MTGFYIIEDGDRAEKGLNGLNELKIDGLNVDADDFGVNDFDKDINEVSITKSFDIG